MNLKGDYNSGTSYSVGDVVKCSDGYFYYLFKPCAAGTTPTDSLYWNRLEDPLAMCCGYVMDALDMGNAGDVPQSAIAPEYSKTTYVKGKIVWHENKLYKSKQNIGTAEDWTAAHWDEVTVGELVEALNTAAATIPTNISDEAITLSAGDDDYLITVDASGEEPELAVTKVEEEAST